MIGTGNRIRSPERKPETTNQFPQSPKGLSGFLVVDLTDEDRWCERRDSNPDLVKDRNLNPETAQRSQLCTRSNDSRDDNFPCAHHHLPELSAS